MIFCSFLLFALNRVGRNLSGDTIKDTYWAVVSPDLREVRKSQKNMFATKVARFEFRRRRRSFEFQTLMNITTHIWNKQKKLVLSAWGA